MTPSSPAADSPEPFRLGHRRWLDGLRGVAILAVVAFHLRLIHGGFLGVDLFFVLSGFLITSLLLEERRARGTIRLGRFYRRRAVRLLPALFVMLGGVLVHAAVTRPEGIKNVKREAMAVACFAANMQDRLHRVPMCELGFTWSLAVEEQFYLVWPAVLLVLLRCGASPRVLLGVIAAGIAGPPAIRLWLYASLPEPTEPRFGYLMIRLYQGPESRGDALLCGCLVAALAHWGYLPRSAEALRRLQSAALVACGLIAGWVVGMHLHSATTYCGGFTVFGLATAVVFACMLSAPLPALNRVLESRPLVWLGRVSYGLFLYHWPLITVLGIDPTHLGWLWPLNTLAALAASLLAAAVSYYAIERPLLRLNDRFRTPAAPAVPAPVPTAPAALPVVDSLPVRRAA